MDLGRDNLVGSTTSGVCPAAIEGAAAFEGVAARRCCSAMTWDFDHRCDFYATSPENRSTADKLLDFLGLCTEAVCVRSAFFRKDLVDRTDRDRGFGSYRLSACQGGIGSFYC